MKNYDPNFKGIKDPKTHLEYVLNLVKDNSLAFSEESYDEVEQEIVNLYKIASNIKYMNDLKIDLESKFSKIVYPRKILALGELRSYCMWSSGTNHPSHCREEELKELEKKTNLIRGLRYHLGHHTDYSNEIQRYFRRFNKNNPEGNIKNGTKPINC